MQNYLVDGVYYFREKDQTSVTGNESEVYHEDDEEPRATSRSDASPSYESLGALDDSSDMSFESWPMVQQETESVTSDAEYPSAATDANYIDLDETSSSSSNDLETRSRQDCVARYLGTMSRLEQPDERLTGDDIEALQNILFARAQNTSSIPRQSFLAHPLWLRLGRTLPATLPQAASTASYIFTVMHHKHPEHWTLGQLDLPQRTFHHYDSLDLPGIQDQVRDEIVPWLENIADMKVGVGEMVSSLLLQLSFVNLVVAARPAARRCSQLRYTRSSCSFLPSRKQACARSCRHRGFQIRYAAFGSARVQGDISPRKVGVGIRENMES